MAILSPPKTFDAGGLPTIILKHNENLYCLWVFQQQFFAQWQFIWFSTITIHVKYNFEFPRELSASIYFILWNNLIPHFDDIFDSREIALKSLIVISSLPLIKSLREKLNWAPLYLKTKSPFSPIADQYQRCVVSLYPPFTSMDEQQLFHKLHLCRSSAALWSILQFLDFFAFSPPTALVHLFWLRWYP